MNVSDLLPVALSLGAGIGFGIFYFCGLWLTVRRLTTARRPVLMSLSSFFGRLAVVLVGFYFVMGGRWERLIACLVGFLAVRIVVVRRWGPNRHDDGVSGKVGAGRDSFHIKISK